MILRYIPAITSVGHFTNREHPNHSTEHFQQIGVYIPEVLPLWVSRGSHMKREHTVAAVRNQANKWHLCLVAWRGVACRGVGVAPTGTKRTNRLFCRSVRFCSVAQRAALILSPCLIWEMMIPPSWPTSALRHVRPRLASPRLWLVAFDKVGAVVHSICFLNIIQYFQCKFTWS